MKKTEIKHSLEKIHWAFIGVLDMIDRPKEILTEHLKLLGDETEAALKLVIALCDYMIDDEDGKVDLTEDLQNIHDEAAKITNGKYGEFSEDAKTDERYPLISRVLINIANMWVEIQHYWDFVEAFKKKPISPPNPDILTTDEQKQAWKKAIKAGFMEKTENGYGWKLKPKNTLAYFAGKLFEYKRVNFNGVLQNVGGEVPYEELESMFNVKRLDRALSQLYAAKKEQRWRKQIDELFE